MTANGYYVYSGGDESVCLEFVSVDGCKLCKYTKEKKSLIYTL